MDRMAILFFYPTRLDGLGGAQISTMVLAEALRKRQHRVGMIEMSSTRSERVAERFGGPVWTVPVFHRPRHAWSWRGFVRSTYDFQRIIRTFKPDIVSLHVPWRQSFPVLGAHVIPHDWRLVVTTHSAAELRSQEAWFQRWLSRLFKRADAVTTVSKALLQDLVTLYPFVRQRSRAIQEGIDSAWLGDPSEPQQPGNERYVLYVGRLERLKGVDVLLEAWKQVHEFAPEFSLWLAGEGRELDGLRALAARLGVATRVRFMGRVHSHYLPALYRGAHLVVLPSRSHAEGLPLVLLEAGACAAVCIATRVGGVPEAIDDTVTGFLAEPESPGALADTVIRGLRMPAAERQAMGIAARKRVAAHFSLERRTAAYEELFRSLLIRRS
jgi:glycosyltransferase involved in cell wall biosynthesis